MDVKFLTGTQSGYEKMSSHDSGTFYLTENNVYLGDFLLTSDDSVNKALQEIAKNASAIEDLENEIGGLSSLDTATKTTIVAAINEVYQKTQDAVTTDAITIEESSSDSYAKVYTIKQGGTTIGIINIPKDLVVESGDVEVNPSGQTAGTYIVLTLANSDNQKIYVNVSDLVDIYTAASGATQVQLSVNGTEISAKLVAGGVGTSELADNAVTNAKLSTDVQNDLGLAESAIQSISGTSPISASTSSNKTTITHNTSGATAGTYGPTGNVSPSEGGTFTVPSVTVDTYGHVTSAASRTITLPNSSSSGISGLDVEEPITMTTNSNKDTVIGVDPNVLDYDSDVAQTILSNGNQGGQLIVGSNKIELQPTSSDSQYLALASNYVDIIFGRDAYATYSNRNFDVYLSDDNGYGNLSLYPGSDFKVYLSDDNGYGNLDLCSGSSFGVYLSDDNSYGNLDLCSGSSFDVYLSDDSSYGNLDLCSGSSFDVYLSDDSSSGSLSLYPGSSFEVYSEEYDSPTGYFNLSVANDGFYYISCSSREKGKSGEMIVDAGENMSFMLQNTSVKKTAEADMSLDNWSVYLSSPTENGVIGITQIQLLSPDGNIEHAIEINVDDRYIYLDSSSSGPYYNQGYLYLNSDNCIEVITTAPANLSWGSI